MSVAPGPQISADDKSQAPTPEKLRDSDFAWEIKTQGGQHLGKLHPRLIGQGLREGWLALEDNARRADEPWDTIRSEASQMGFYVQVYVDTPRAFANWYALLGVLAMAIASPLLLTAYLSVTMLGKTVAWGILFGVGVLAIISLALLLSERLGFSLWRGCLTILLGIALWSIALGIHNLSPADAFLKSLLIGVPISAIVGGAVGYAPAYKLGHMVGKRRIDQYQVSSVRQPLPEWLHK